MRKIYGFLAVFLIAAGGTAWADDITADVLTYDGKAKTVIATGNVVIHANEGAVVTGKKGQYYFENRSAWLDRKSTRLNSSHYQQPRMPSSA